MRKALVIYLMSEPETPELAEAAVEGGADVVELGFPFSDPLADGPVIRRAAERALARGMRTHACLECLAKVRERVGDTALVPMTYSSLLEAYGWERFATDARDAGATSLIIADLPGRRPAGAASSAAGGADVHGRADRARGTADGRLALPRHASPGRPASGTSSPTTSPAWPSAHAEPVPASPCTPGSGSRHPSRPGPRRTSRTAWWSAREHCSPPRRAPVRFAISSAPCGTRSTRSSARPPGGPRRPGVGG